MKRSQVCLDCRSLKLPSIKRLGLGDVYWGVENKVHHVRDVTQGEDASRIRMHQLPQIFAVARNFALNLYRSNAFSNMAQAERLCKNGLDTLKAIFRMK